MPPPRGANRLKRGLAGQTRLLDGHTLRAAVLRRHVDRDHVVVRRGASRLYSSSLSTF